MAYNKDAKKYRKIFMDSIDIIAKDFNNGKTIKELCKEYSVCYQFCSNALIETGIKKGKRKYMLDETYFDNIDTPNKAYILGLWYSDGCNQIRNNRTNEGKYHVCIALQESDRDILEKIKKELKYDGEIKIIKPRDSIIENRIIKKENCQNQCTLELFSKQLSLDLEKHGVIQNKSLKLKFPISLDKSLYPHFIRGYFDGDGSIFYSSKKYEWKIISTKDFCETVKNIIESTLNIKLSIEYNVHNNNVTSVLKTQDRNNVKLMLDWIYCDADMFLDRKHNKYLSLFYLNNSLSA